MHFKDLIASATEIILKISYAGKNLEIKQKYTENGFVKINRSFEFKAKSKKDNLKISRRH